MLKYVLETVHDVQAVKQLMFVAGKCKDQDEARLVQVQLKQEELLLLSMRLNLRRAVGKELKELCAVKGHSQSTTGDVEQNGQQINGKVMTN